MIALVTALLQNILQVLQTVADNTNKIIHAQDALSTKYEAKIDDFVERLADEKVKEKLKEFEKTVDEEKKDMNKRIQNLETKFWIMTGVGATIFFIVDRFEFFARILGQ